MVKAANASTMVIPVHRLTPWFRVRITTGDSSITTEHWQSLLGFIPLRRRRIEVPFAGFASIRIQTMVRVQCLAAAVVLIAAIFVLRPPVVAIVGLAILGLYQLTLFAPNKALRIERTDGQSWTVRFCRDYDFDVSMAFEDAARLRDAVRPVSTPSPRKDEAAA